MRHAVALVGRKSCQSTHTGSPGSKRSGRRSFGSLSSISLTSHAWALVGYSSVKDHSFDIPIRQFHASQILMGGMLPFRRPSKKIGYHRLHVACPTSDPLSLWAVVANGGLRCVIASHWLHITPPTPRIPTKVVRRLREQQKNVDRKAGGVEFGKHPEARPRSALRGKACWGEEGWRLLAGSGRRGRSAPQGSRGSGEATTSTPSTLLAYTDADVAAMLDVSRRTVYRLRKSGRLPASVLAGRARPG